MQPRSCSRAGSCRRWSGWRGRPGRRLGLLGDDGRQRGHGCTCTGRPRCDVLSSTFSALGARQASGRQPQQAPSRWTRRPPRPSPARSRTARRWPRTDAPARASQMILQPEGLGTVTIKSHRWSAAGLAVHLAVDNPARRVIWSRASWPQLQSALEQRGLTRPVAACSTSRTAAEATASSSRRSSSSPVSSKGSAGQSGQQGRSGSSSGDRRGIGAVDGVAAADAERPQAGVGTASRVDYRI